MTSIASSATRARSSGRRKKLRTPAKKSRTSSSAKAFSKDSIGTRCVTFENPAAGAAPTRRVALSLPVVFGIADLGHILRVIELIVVCDFGGKPGEFPLCLLFGQQFDGARGDVGRCLVGL